MSIDFKKIKKVYIIGIKGAGVANIAVLLKKEGKDVSGSDTDEKFFTDEILEKEGISFFEEFDPAHIANDLDLVVYSTAYNEDNNEELKTAKDKKVTMLSYPEILGEIFAQKFGIAVCGTHGKTTTSALMAHVLKETENDPSAVIGSKVKSWDSNALLGEGKFMVIEADEYQNKLRLYNPMAVILTSVDWDHPDFFRTFEDYKRAFKDFVAKIPRHGFLVYCEDDPDVLEVVKKANCQKISYGVNSESEVLVSDIDVRNPFQSFNVSINKESVGTFESGLFGQHNASNVAATVAMSYFLKLDMEKVKEAVKSFQGTARRFDKYGQYNGAELIDDYAHHPLEVQVVLRTARKLYPDKKIIAVFHPHSFSRTEALLDEFGESFENADQVIVLDIYGSAREASGKVHSRDLVELINKHNPGKARYIATIDEVVEYLESKASQSNVILTLGAGNVWEILQRLKS